MNFIADFHIHSKYSRATARNLDFENLYINAQIKGITVLGTGDFTHPAWWQEIQDKLVPAEDGLFKLKPDIARACDEKVPLPCRRPVRFMLVTEISNIYKKKDRTRKNHNLVFMPDLDRAALFNHRLDDIGNIQSDGRPILGLDARNLLEIVLEITDSGYLVPAHIWTPWFSLLGSKSGFDAVDECFEDLTSHIFALETGLSSDPAMNQRVSHLDHYTLISNSDAHSPSKLGREANHFNTELSYFAIRSAMETADPNQFLGTIEFYPEEGKYHVDGHRKCRFRSDPAKTRELDGICPVCGKPLTLGVLYRVEELADRQYGACADRSCPYINLIPLEDVLSEVFQVGVNTKKVNRAYHQLIQNHGSEFDILCHEPKASLEKNNIPLLAEAVIRMREGRIIFDPGYDGEFGRVRIFDPSERDMLQGQQRLFDIPEEAPTQTQNPVIREPICTGKENLPVPKDIEDDCVPHTCSETKTTGFYLNEEQQAAVNYDGGALLICAGPGTGKTRTITCKMAALIETSGIAADHILAVTFTNKAAQEMRHRLETMLPPGRQLPLVATFHGFCWQLLQEIYDGEPGAIVDEAGRRAIIEDAIEMVNTERAGQTNCLSSEKMIDQIVQAKQQLLGPDDELGIIVENPHTHLFKEVYARYQKLLTLQDLFDFEDLLFRVVKFLKEDLSWKNRVQKRFSHIFVDEFQDINDIQYRLLRALAPPKAQVCVIGDPDQAIYGFRGSNVGYFKKFIQDYKKTQVIRLTRNYRSTETLLASCFQVIENHQVKLLEDDQARTYSDIDDGPSFISVLETTSAQAEAVAIGRTIEQMVGGMGFHSIDFEKLDSDSIDKECGFADFAVLCRTGDQVQTISRKLVSAGIPCQMVSRRALQQPAVAKLLAAFRVVTGQGAYADVGLLTDLGAPGISKETLSIFKQWAYDRQLPLVTALHSAHRLSIPSMSAARQQRLVALVRLLERLKNACADLYAAEAIHHIASETTLSSKVEADDLDRLITLARPYGPNKKAFGCALAIDIDTDLYQPGVEKVSVMTLHAAKGLEFPVVFVAGCEDRMIPYLRPGKKNADVEEERRLFYVGMTRAGRQLYLSWARRRSMYGQTRTRKLSPFVLDINEDYRKHLTYVCKARKPKQKQLSLF
jgi:uncharacterized protein (TIGR00375 family)